MDVQSLVKALRDHVGEVYGTLDKGSTGRNIRHDAAALARTIRTAFPATAHDPQRASMDDLLAFGGIGTGTFIGKNALTWDEKAAKKAAGLLKRGIDPEKVWQRHMTGQMPDGALFQEIDDSAARIGNVFMKDNPISWAAKDLMRENPERPNINIANLMSHDGIYRAYPELENTGVNFSGDLGGSMRLPKLGQTNYQMDLGELEKGASVPLHELQHSIQDIEGWSRGGSPEYMASDLGQKQKKLDHYAALSNLIKDAIRDYGGNIDLAVKANRDIGLDITDAQGKLAFNMGEDQVNKYLQQARNELEQFGDLKYRKPENVKADLYRRLTGEAQARATQERLSMGMDERRTNYPLKGGMLADIPLDQLIYKYGTIEGKP